MNDKLRHVHCMNECRTHMMRKSNITKAPFGSCKITKECLKSLSTNKKNGMPYLSPCFVKCDKAEPTKRWDIKVQTSKTPLFFFFFFFCGMNQTGETHGTLVNPRLHE